MGRTPAWKKEKRRRKRSVEAQKKAANIRAKYGPKRKPSPVIVKIAGSDEVTVVDQSVFARRKER